MIPQDVRDRIGATLTGDVLEIGPGHAPFPVADGARLTLADRKVAGGRDANFPELVGQPHGPSADVDLDLDLDGLRPFGDGAFDAVVASHIVEHLANPVAALAEAWRTLRPGGRLVLLMPDRGHTFDEGRAPTPLAHVLDEYRRGVTKVDDDHIREFCAAIHAGPVIHPPEVRSWHDPDGLDDEMLALHRRRSIHVHCWSPEEFVALIAGLAADGVATWRLVEDYVRDDLDASDPGIEFGLVLERVPADDPEASAVALARTWAERVLADPRREPRRVALLADALRRDLPTDGPVVAAVEALVPVAEQIAGLRDALRGAETTAADAATSERAASQRADAAEARADEASTELAALRQSRSYRTAQAVAAPLARLRGRARTS